jgi:putative membrane protein
MELPEGFSPVQVGTELAMRRTGLAFQRTRVSADRTLMAVIRTSLSLISFGFTIFQFFRSLHQAGTVNDAAFTTARRFGLSLLFTGIGLLIAGLVFHIRFNRSLRGERTLMVEHGFLHGQLPYPVSLTTIIALILLVIGTLTVIGIIVREGPFQ